jgi:acyl-coenzyme A thioesterase PaaI-like protein
MITQDQIDALRGDYDHCFACGSANPIGLHLGGFRVDGDSVVAEWAPGPQFRGFESTLHGGIIATALDEILAWAGIYFEGVLAVTVKLDLKYQAPAPPDVEFTLRGRVDSRSGSRLRSSGELESAAGLHATATGLYLVRTEVP